MPEQNQSSLYDRYLKAVRANPGHYVLVKNGNGYVTFDLDCWPFSVEIDHWPVNANRHWRLNVTAKQAERLKLKFDIVEA